MGTKRNKREENKNNDSVKESREKEKNTERKKRKRKKEENRYRRIWFLDGGCIEDGGYFVGYDFDSWSDVGIRNGGLVSIAETLIIISDEYYFSGGIDFLPVVILPYPVVCLIKRHHLVSIIRSRIIIDKTMRLYMISKGGICPFYYLHRKGIKISYTWSESSDDTILIRKRVGIPKSRY